MSKQTNKQHLRAKNIVDKALTVFTNTIKEVGKANEVLLESLDGSKAKQEQLATKIKEANKELLNIENEQRDVRTEIEANKELIKKLNSFAK